MQSGVEGARMAPVAGGVVGRVTTCSQSSSVMRGDAQLISVELLPARSHISNQAARPLLRTVGIGYQSDLKWPRRWPLLLVMFHACPKRCDSSAMCLLNRLVVP